MHYKWNFERLERFKNSKLGRSYIDSPIEKTMHSVIYDDTCFQYAATVTLNHHQQIEIHLQRRSKLSLLWVNITGKEQITLQEKMSGNILRKNLLIALYLLYVKILINKCAYISKPFTISIIKKRNLKKTLIFVVWIVFICLEQKANLYFINKYVKINVFVVLQCLLQIV